MAYITLQKLLECVKPCRVVHTWSLHTWEAVEGKVNYVPRPRLQSPWYGFGLTHPPEWDR